MTALTEVMSTTDAERITTRITLMAGTIREGVEKLHELVQQAKDGNAHVALGYASWTAYLADVLGKQPIRLDAPERRELVAYLSGEGMSTRAIAPIVGVSVGQTHADRVAGVQALNTSVDRETGEITETTVPTPAAAWAGTVTGLDGKTYERPAPSAPKSPPRRPLADQFLDATYELTKAVERLERLVNDDRFTQNAEKVAQRNRGDLLRASDSLAGVISTINDHSGV